MARLIEPRDPELVTVTVRHHCPTFAFGSALGPHELVSWWWWHNNVVTIASDAYESRPAVESAIVGYLEGLTDYRRHLDELQELPG